MKNEKLNVVTGAYGYTGKYITGLLLKKGIRVKTLTDHPRKENPFAREVKALPYNFGNPQAMVENLRGVDTVYNTYWVRFDRGEITQGQAVANIQNLIHAAKEAGVRRFVHISITNPDENSNLPYFKGKGIMENTLKASGLSYAIVRPALLFGEGDILINNIAWMLRRFPVYGVFGDGTYRLQPVYVEDVAALAVEAGGKDEDVAWDAVGPETYSFEGLVRMIKKEIKSHAQLLHISPAVGRLSAHFLNPILRDVTITKEEIEGLMAELLVSKEPPRCPTRFSNWLGENKAKLGTRYASELKRHYQR
ncbi:MAG: NAD(P)H-binding protein [Thermodesulfobacteriota bacterium]